MKQVYLHHVLLSLVVAFALPAGAQSTAFTYQGRLTDGNNPANGHYDMTFTLYGQSSGGVAVAGPVTNTAVAVTNGLFTVPLDFGAGVFSGSSRWVEMGVRSNSVAVVFTTLGPRQPLTPAPYALYSPNAGTASTVAPASVTAAGIANGQVVKSLNGLKDSVTLSSGANVTLATNGGNLTISSTGGGAVFALNGTNAYYNSGNIGIGTTTPDFRLSVYDGALALGGANSAWQDSAVILNANFASPDAGKLLFGDGTGWKFHFQNRNSADLLTIQDNGYIGIGTISPQSALHVFGTLRWGGWSPTTHAYSDIDGAGLFLEQVGDSVATSTMRFQSSRAGGLSAYSKFFINPETGFSFMGSGGANGNVGIGTTSPAYKMEIAGVSFNDGLAVTGAASPGLTLNSSSGKDWKIFASGAGVSMGAGGLAFYNSTDDSYRMVIDTIGNVGIGTYTPQTKLDVVGETRTCVLTISGGCDLSEPFEFDADEVPPGAVVIIDQENPGRLKLSNEAYDKRVAGIVSGANGIKPGITMHQEGKLEGGRNVALSGRVYALADTSNGSIKPGDLLTTSLTPGHCMKATDPATAQGAIIGKAMSGLKEGKGMVLVLVTLQ